jgi:hypothetical protein
MTDLPVFTWADRIEMLRATFASELRGEDEAGWLLELVALMGTPARLVASLRDGSSERRVWDVRTHVASELFWLAAASVEVAERLLEPRT